MIPDGRASRVDQDGGLLTVDRKVVKAIVHQEASQVPGVVELGGDSIVKRFVRWLGLRPWRRGVTLEVGDGEAAMNIDVVCRYGVSIPELCREMRERVTRALKVMAGIDVRVINVRIRSIKGARRRARTLALEEEAPADLPTLGPPPGLDRDDDDLEAGPHHRFRGGDPFGDLPAS